MKEDYRRDKREAVTEAAKQKAFDFDKERRETWLMQARDLAYRIALADGEVTADDLHKHLPIPDGVDRRIVGSVFNGMQCIRYQKSKRKQCHFRPIGVFTIKGKRNEV